MFDRYPDVTFLEISCSGIVSRCHRERVAQEAPACAPNSKDSRSIHLEEGVRKVKMVCAVHVKKRQRFSCMMVIAILTFFNPSPHGHRCRKVCLALGRTMTWMTENL
uniref:Uncharacterized protein n=1 Tax=Micrurus corallinus TaxID=54390 RepID=A0A2D4EX98_MICCO